MTVSVYLVVEPEGEPGYQDNHEAGNVDGYLVVKLEGEPGYHDNHEAGNVDGYKVEGQLPSKRQVNLSIIHWTQFL